MTKSILSGYLLTVILLLVTCFQASGTPGYDTKHDDDKYLKHVVYVNFKPQATAAVLEEMTRDLKALKDKIPAIRRLEWGVNIHPNREFSHCLIISFKNNQDFETYQQHPAHKNFAEKYSGYIQKVKEEQLFMPVIYTRKS